MVTATELREGGLSAAGAPAGPAGGADFATAVASVPITHQHGVESLRGLDKRLPNPGLPRANLTVDAEHPQGTYQPPDMTVMQQHIAFWDRDGDGMIWPGDTYTGFRRLGFNLFLSAIAVPIIHGTFSWWTQHGWAPDPAFRIRVANIHRGKHGSDSETFDTEGRFVPQKFEEAFAKYDRGGKGGLTLREVNEMVRGNRNIMDPVGWIAGWLEWNVSYYLAARDTPHGRLVSKDDVRGIIDGTLFHRVAEQVESGRLRMRETKGGMERRPGAPQKKEE